MNANGFVLAEDVATAISGAFNAGYFIRYWLRRSERRRATISRGAACFASWRRAVDRNTCCGYRKARRREGVAMT